MRGLPLRHIEGHEGRDGHQPQQRGQAPRESGNLIMYKYKTAEGLPGPCKQAIPATLQAQGKRAWQ